jgi:hypothetical protein
MYEQQHHESQKEEEEERDVKGDPLDTTSELSLLSPELLRRLIATIRW